MVLKKLLEKENKVSGYKIRIKRMQTICGGNWGGRYAIMILKIPLETWVGFTWRMEAVAHSGVVRNEATSARTTSGQPDRKRQEIVDFISVTRGQSCREQALCGTPKKKKERASINQLSLVLFWSERS